MFLLPRRFNAYFSLQILLALNIGLVASAAPLPDPALNLSAYKMTFDDEFLKADVTAHGPNLGASRWIAHTPWNGDFGDAAFDDPGQNGPFAFGPGGLVITAHQDGHGKWHGGLICSEDKDGLGQRGFSQKYGYFEMMAKLPDGPGVWPAFWLIGTDKTRGSAELDVMEYYGVSNHLFHSTEHYWVKGGKDAIGQQNTASVSPGLLSQQFNRYGVLITSARTVFYLNRQEIWSTPTPPVFRQPMYILANLALGGGWPIDKLHTTQVMQIQYIRAYTTK